MGEGGLKIEKEVVLRITIHYRSSRAPLKEGSCLSFLL
jgi:hypothetical protein